MKRLLVGLALLAAVVGVVPAMAAGAPSRVAIARYNFAGVRDGVLTVRGSVDLAPGALFSEVSVEEPVAGHPYAFFPQVLDLGKEQGVQGYGQGDGVSLCSAPFTCTVSGGKFSFSASYTVSTDGKTPAHVSYYIAVRGPHATIHDGVLVHWTAKHWSGGLVTRTDSDAAGGGLDVIGEDVGVTTGVTAAGARGGSVVIFVPACDVAGAGAMSLSGGLNPPTALCPSGPVTDVALRATTWSASGAVAGVSDNQARLVVLPR